MDNKRKTSKWLVPTGLVLIFVAIIMMLVFLLKGQTTIIGEYDGQKNTETLVCESNDLAYSFFAFDGSDSKSLKINAIFNESTIQSISLVYKLNYHDGDTQYYSESRNHSEMNQYFSKDGMKPDSMNAKYSAINNALQFSIFVDRNDITSKTIKYYMLNNVYNVEKLSIKEAAEYYNKKGLGCKIKQNNTEEVNEK